MVDEVGVDFFVVHLHRVGGFRVRDRAQVHVGDPHLQRAHVAQAEREAEDLLQAVPVQNNGVADFRNGVVFAAHVRRATR